MIQYDSVVDAVSIFLHGVLHLQYVTDIALPMANGVTHMQVNASGVSS
jgi:hypothetical protein